MTTTINKEEIQKFSKLADEWWDVKGKFKPLHMFNPIRIEYITDKIKQHFKLNDKKTNFLKGLNILDIGCGGGLISEPMARLGGSITGIDASEKNLSRILTLKESKNKKGTNETVKIKDLIFASTGVIGEEYPVEKIKDRLPSLVEKLRYEHNKMYWIKIASAIMTTDTKPKVAYEEIIVGDELIKICGIAKGSGMIAPNLATMLSFIFTNADINSNLLKTILKRSVANSFNAITVDSDQSTNDMVSISSTSALKIGQNLSLNDNAIQKFEIALKKLCLNLAKQIVIDGEGAKKFVTVNVINAKSLSSAKNIAFSVANSPLVKTAIAGEDPNWGRIVMGIGKSGEIIDQKKLKVKIGDFIVAENGKIAENYNEEKIKEFMQWDSIEIEINLKLGNDAFKCYTCDFTHDYIDINADYRN